MTRVLKLLTLVLSFAALQLTLLGGGPECPTAGSGGEYATVATMAGRAMPTPPAPPRDPVAATHEGRAAAAHRAAGHEAPCDEPATQQDQQQAQQTCLTMAPCLFAVVLPTPRAVVSAVVGTPSAVAVRAGVRTPASETRAPELPPPRA